MFFASVTYVIIHTLISLLGIATGLAVLSACSKARGRRR